MEDGTPYEVRGSESKRALTYQPEFLARGGEHLVYTLPDYPNYVAKVNADSVYYLVKQNLEEGHRIDQLPLTPERVQVSDQSLEAENARFERMKHYFGEEHVLDQSKHRLKVPITREIIATLFRRHKKDLPANFDQYWADQAWSIITFQKKAPEILDPSHLDIHGSYSEKQNGADSEEFKGSYKRVTDSLVISPEQKKPIDINELLVVQPALKALIQECEFDPKLRAQVADFVQKAIQFSNQTGEILDLAGSDNVVLLKDQNGNWNYLMPDALYPGPATWSNQLERTRQTITEVAAELKKDPNANWDKGSNYSLMLNNINYVRTINGLARYLGLEGYISLVPPGVEITSEQILKLIRERFMSSR